MPKFKFGSFENRAQFSHQPVSCDLILTNYTAPFLMMVNVKGDQRTNSTQALMTISVEELSLLTALTGARSE